MKIRISSDGTGIGTHVTDERGERLEMVSAVEWGMPDPRGLATARVTFQRVPVNIQARAARLVLDPKTAHLVEEALGEHLNGGDYDDEERECLSRVVGDLHEQVGRE